MERNGHEQSDVTRGTDNQWTVWNTSMTTKGGENGPQENTKRNGETKQNQNKLNKNHRGVKKKKKEETIFFM